MEGAPALLEPVLLAASAAEFYADIQQRGENNGRAIKAAGEQGGHVRHVRVHGCLHPGYGLS